MAERYFLENYFPINDFVIVTFRDDTRDTSTNKKHVNKFQL